MIRFYFKISLAILLPLVGFAQSERSLVREGNKLYKNEKYNDAEVNYRKALEKSKDLHQGEFNLGDALYKQERYGEAAERYRIAAEKQSDGEVKSQTLYNLGNALLKEQKIPESIKAYKEALKLNPKDADTKYNLEYAKTLLKNLQKQQQQKQDQKKEDKQQQKQDQQRQEQQKQDQQKQQKEKQQQAEQNKQQLSKKDAERILEALRNEEKDVQKKLKKRVPARVKIEKDW